MTSERSDCLDSDERRKRSWFWLPTALGILVLVAVYVGAYVRHGARDGTEEIVQREFDSPTACGMFSPAGWLESQVRRKPVQFIRRPNAADLADLKARFGSLPSPEDYLDGSGPLFIPDKMFIREDAFMPIGF